MKETSLSHRALQILNVAKPLLQKLGLFTLCSALFYRCVLLNRYPVLYPWDTSSYINIIHTTGLLGERFRPAGYSAFLYLSSFNSSLYFSMAAQAMLMTFMTIAFLKSATGMRLSTKTVLVCTFLTYCTRISYLSSYVHPDVLTGTIFIVLYCYGQTHRRWLEVLALSYLALMPFMHISFFAICLLTAMATSFFCKFSKRKNIGLLIMLVLVWGTVSAIKQVQPNQLNRPAYHYFVLGRMAAEGLLVQYLDKHCDTAHYNICHHRNKLTGIDSTQFEWGENPWAPDSTGNNQREMSTLLSDIAITEPVMLAAFVGKNFAYFVLQWTLAVAPPEFMLHDIEIDSVRTYYPKDLSALLESKVHTQPNIFRQKLQLTYTIETWGKIFCMAALVLLLIRKKWWHVELSAAKSHAIVGLLCLILVNGIICANGSGLYARYYDRLHWLIFLVFAVCAEDVYRMLNIDYLVAKLHRSLIKKPTRRSVL